MGEGAHIVFLVLKYKTTGGAGWEDLRAKVYLVGCSGWHEKNEPYRINLRRRAEVDLGGEQMM